MAFAIADIFKQQRNLMFLPVRQWERHRPQTSDPAPQIPAQTAAVHAGEPRCHRFQTSVLPGQESASRAYARPLAVRPVLPPQRQDWLQGIDNRQAFDRHLKDYLEDAKAVFHRLE